MENANRASSVVLSPILDFLSVFITNVFTPENHEDRVKLAAISLGLKTGKVSEPILNWFPTCGIPADTHYHMLSKSNCLPQQLKKSGEDFIAILCSVGCADALTGAAFRGDVMCYQEV